MVTGDEVRAFAATLPRIAAEPGKFLLPEPSDLRFRWMRCRLAAIDAGEMRELVVEAWRMCVPRKVRTAYLETHPLCRPPDRPRRPPLPHRP